MRREVYEALGGFDESLPTAEDLEFHLRIARHWRIGVIDRPLVQMMRGDEGLSTAASSYADYVRVYEEFAARSRGQLPAALLHRALSAAYVRNVGGLLRERRWQDARAMIGRIRRSNLGWRYLPCVASVAALTCRGALSLVAARVRR
jgi:hypothetical protein